VRYIWSSTRLRNLATALRCCNRLGHEPCGGDSKWIRAKNEQKATMSQTKILPMILIVLIDETAEQLQKLTNSV